MASRYVAFYQSVSNNSKFAVRFLANISAGDNRTVFGRTLQSIAVDCSLTPSELSSLTPAVVRSKYFYKKPSEETLWQANIASELLHIRERQLDLPNFSAQEIEEMLTYTCIV